MADGMAPEYVLTVVQHTYCSDCIWIKGKITDVYHASGIVRGEDSKRWRMHILSPPWERDARTTEFPSGFESVDVPALKLVVGSEVALATQNPDLINEILVKLKVMLMNRLPNSKIRTQLDEIIRNWKDSPHSTTCMVTSR
jgi:hypothetical protein